MKSFTGRQPMAPRSSWPQRREPFESRGRNGSELQMLEGARPAGLAGDSSLATSPPNWGHQGSLPAAPNTEKRNEQSVKGIGKVTKGKAESSKNPNACRVSWEQPEEIPASKAILGCLVPLCPEALQESTSSPRGGHLAEDGPGLGEPEEGENGMKPIAGLTDINQVGEDLPLALGLSVSPLGREVDQLQGFRAPKGSFSQTDKGLQRQPKLSGGQKLPGSGAPPGPKAALPKMKRQKADAEASQEACKKARGTLGTQMLEAIQVFHALGKKKEDRTAAVPIPQVIAKIPERWEAPAGVLQTAREASRLSPVLSGSSEVEQPHNFGATKSSVVPVDRGLQMQRKLRPGQGPADGAAEAEEGEAAPRKKRKRDHPEPSPDDCQKLPSFVSTHRLESGKKNHEMTGSVRDPQPTSETPERLEAPAEDLAVILEALRLPALLSPLREVEQPKGLHAPKGSMAQMEKGHEPASKGGGGKKSSGSYAEAEQKTAVPRLQPQKQPSQDVWKKPRSLLDVHMLESVQVLHPLGKRKEKRAGPVRVPQPTATTQVRWQAPALEALRLPRRHSPSKEVHRRNDLGIPEARAVQVARGLRGQPKPWPGQGLSESAAEPEEEAVPLTTTLKGGHSEPPQEVWKKRRTFPSAHVRESPKKKDTLAGTVGVPQPTPELQGRRETPAEGPGAMKTQLGPLGAARNKIRKAQPIAPKPAVLGSAALPPAAPREEQTPERDRMKMKAQQEREHAARYTALGQRNFFAERQQDMEIAKHYGYMV